MDGETQMLSEEAGKNGNVANNDRPYLWPSPVLGSEHFRRISSPLFEKQ